jgi:very-short-patch-repair endonuclease
MVSKRTDAMSPPPKGGLKRREAFQREGGYNQVSSRRWAESSARKNARRLRRELTDAERQLWVCLRSKQIEAFRFRKQVPLGRFVADFACMEPKLIVEVDGGQHADRADHDADRTAWLEGWGFTVLRFWNNEVSENMDGVLQVIVNTLHEIDSDD